MHVTANSVMSLNAVTMLRQAPLRHAGRTARQERCLPKNEAWKKKARTGVRASDSILSLEKIFQRELHDARVTRRLQLSKCAVAYRVVRVVEIRVVEQVEEFAPELNLSEFMDGELLEQGEVHIHQARPRQEVSACLSKGTGRCILEGRSVEVGVHTS